MGEGHLHPPCEMAHNLDRRLSVLEDRYVNIDNRLARIEANTTDLKKLIVGNGEPGILGRLGKLEWIVFTIGGVAGAMVPVVVREAILWMVP